MNKLLSRFIKVLLVGIVLFGGTVTAAMNNNEDVVEETVSSQIIHESDILSGGEIEEITEANVEEQAEEALLEEDASVSEVSVEETVENQTDVDLQEESVESDSIASEINAPRLEANSVIVYTYAELKSYIESRGGINQYTYYYMGADLVQTTGINVPNGYSFTLDGFDPVTYEHHMFTETTSPTSSNNIYYSGALANTMTLKNMYIKGQNYYGTMRATVANTTMVYDTIQYAGPQITHNPYGSAIYRNSDIEIGGATYKNPSQEVGEVNHVTFEGRVEIHQYANYVLFNTIATPTITFNEGANVIIRSLNGMNNTQTNAKVVFNEGSKLSYTQTGTSSPSVISLGTGSEFTMKQNSVLDVTRESANDATGGVINGNSAVNGTVILIDHALINVVNRGGQTTAPLIRGKDLTMDNSEFNATIDGNSSYATVYTYNQPILKSTKVNIEVSKIMSTGSASIGVFHTALSGQDLTLESSSLVLKASTLQASVVRAALLNINDSHFEVNTSNTISANVISSTKDLSFKNTKVIVEVGRLTFPLFEGSAINVIDDTDIDVNILQSYNSTSVLGAVVLNSPGAVNVKDSSIDVEALELTAGTADRGQLVRGSAVELNNSKIHANIGSTTVYNNATFYTSNLRILNQSEVHVKYNGLGKGFINNDKAAVTLDNSSVIITAPKLETVVANAGTFYATDSKFIVKTDDYVQRGTANEYPIKLENFDFKDSDFQLVLKEGTYSAPVRITDKTFHFNGNLMNKFLIYAPKGSVLLSTSKEISVVVTGSQMNFWDHASNGGFDSLPNRRHLRNDDANGYIDIKYNSAGSSETVTWIGNGYNHEDWQNPMDLFSLRKANSMIWSAGNFNVITQPLIAQMTEVVGTTETSAEIRLKYTSGGVENESISIADADGHFTLQTSPLDGGDFEVEGYLDYLYAVVPVIVEEVEVLHFGMVPQDIIFGTHMIPTRSSLINRLNPMSVEIIDRRSSGTDWRLELRVIKELHDVDNPTNVIKNGLVYKNEHGKVVDLPINTSVEIARSNGSTNPVEVISWQNDEGILIRLSNPEKISVGVSYTARIQWILTDMK